MSTYQPVKCIPTINNAQGKAFHALDFTSHLETPLCKTPSDINQTRIAHITIYNAIEISRTTNQFFSSHPNASPRYTLIIIKK